MIGNYFTTLFTLKCLNIEYILDCIEERVSLSQNKDLPSELTINEVKEALFDMNSNKALDHDVI